MSKDSTTGADCRFNADILSVSLSRSIWRRVCRNVILIETVKVASSQHLFRRSYSMRVSEIGCLTSQGTIFQLYMWRHIDVQADWRRSWTYGRAPNAIDISQGSLTCPSKHRHGTTLFIRWFRHTAPFSRLLRSRWGYGGHILNFNPRALTGFI